MFIRGRAGAAWGFSKQYFFSLFPLTITNVLLLTEPRSTQQSLLCLPFSAFALKSFNYSHNVQGKIFTTKLISNKQTDPPTGTIWCNSCWMACEATQSQTQALYQPRANPTIVILLATYTTPLIHSVFRFSDVATFCPHWSTSLQLQIWLQSQSFQESVLLNFFVLYIKMLGNINASYFSLIIGSLKPSGHYLYHQVLHSTIPRSTHIMYLSVFMALRTKSGYFPIRNKLHGLLRSKLYVFSARYTWISYTQRRNIIASLWPYFKSLLALRFMLLSS